MSSSAVLNPVRWLSRVFRALPLTWALAVARGFAWVWWWLLPVRRAVALRNVALAFPGASPRERRRIVRGCLEHLAMFGVESLRLPDLDGPRAESLVRAQHPERLYEAIAKGKGVVAVTAHLGNFDLFGCAWALRGVKLHVVYKDIHWRPAHDFFFAARRGCGVNVIPPKGSERQILRALRNGEVVAFVIDQHMPQQRGLVTSFFGKLVSTTPAPALFALKTGAAVLPAVMVRDSRPGYHITEFFPEMAMETPYADMQANLRHNTQRLNDWLEQQVRRWPEQWLWLHRRWKVHDRPDGWEIPPELQPLARRAP